MPHRLVGLARRRLGRRGTILAGFGVVWILHGFVVLSRADGPHVLLNEFEHLRSLVWILTGLTAVLAAPRRQDRWGWLALYVMASYRALAYGVTVWQWAVSGFPAGAREAEAAGAMSGVLSWLVILIVIRIASGWREHFEDLAAPTGPLPLIDPEEGANGRNRGA